MRRRRADSLPKTPLLNDATASRTTTTVAPGQGRGAPPPPAPPPLEVRTFVYRLMLSGATRERIADMAEQNVPPFGRELVFRTYADICFELGNAANLPEHSREHLRAQAGERLRNELVALRMRRQALGKLDHEQFTAMTREVRHLEGLLADLEGTRMPVEVDLKVDMDVRVRSATMRVITAMTAEDFAAIGRELRDGRG